MIEPPTSVFGYPTRPEHGLAPCREEAASVRLSDGSIAAVTLLRWEGGSLNVDGISLVGSWVLTLLVEIAGRRLHLWQRESIFYTDAKAPLLESAEPPLPTQSACRPRWSRRSNRHWPALQGRPLAFLGQFSTSRHSGYLFASDHMAQLAIHLQQLNEQDIEDHYEGEGGGSDA